jgi:hypothetical protein
MFNFPLKVFRRPKDEKAPLAVDVGISRYFDCSHRINSYSGPY